MRDSWLLTGLTELRHPTNHDRGQDGRNGGKQKQALIA
jgi:hypothetical protein